MALYIDYPQLDFSKLKPIKAEISVSGISSGAYMAEQYHVANSKRVKSATLFAVGPYYCSQGNSYNALNACMDTKDQLSIDDSIDKISELEARGVIDPSSNVKNSKVTIINGKRDLTVKESVSSSAVDFYKKLGVKKVNYLNTFDIAHTFPTINKGNDCKADSSSPYISSCGIDGAKIVFKTFKPLLVKSPREYKENRLFYIKQWEDYSIDNLYVSKHAVAYVPEACEKSNCDLHISFHGCRQTRFDIDDQYIKDTGLINYAESNKTIVLFPQTLPNLLWNPNGCWDWWGYSGTDFYSNEASQIKVVNRLVEKFN